MFKFFLIQKNVCLIFCWILGNLKDETIQNQEVSYVKFKLCYKTQLIYPECKPNLIKFNKLN